MFLLIGKVYDSRLSEFRWIADNYISVSCSEWYHTNIVIKLLIIMILLSHTKPEISVIDYSVSGQDLTLSKVLYLL